MGKEKGRLKESILQKSEIAEVSDPLFKGGSDGFTALPPTASGDNRSKLSIGGVGSGSGGFSMNALRMTILGAAVAALGAVAVPAFAQVRYDFTALSSIPTNNNETFSGSFSVILPDFVTGDTTVPLGSLSSCTVVVSPAATAACGPQQKFLTSISPPLVTISFDVETLANPGRGIYYYFESGAFGSVGTHESVLLGREQAGRLVVTAVPEPAQWATLALGLGGLGLVARRRRTPG